MTKVEVDLRMPAAWSHHVFFRVWGSCVAMFMTALSKRTFALGFELIDGRAKGVAVYIGPIWLGLAVGKVNSD